MSLDRRWLYVASVGIAAVVAYLAVNAATGGQHMLQDDSISLGAASSHLGSLTIVTLVDGDLAQGTVYRIAPNPYSSEGNSTLSDGDPDIDTSRVSGIITIEGVPDGTYSVIQLIGPEGQQRDVVPRVVSLENGSSKVITFGANSVGGSETSGPSSLENIESIIYSAKFECGTIRGTEGPLRPGHYDTDIGIFNKQNFPLKVAWTSGLNDNLPTNAILKTLKAQTSTSIVCNDIRAALNHDDAFMEGFVVLEVPVDPILVSSLSGASSVLDSGSKEGLDLLDVQIFYTANALEELPHPVLVDKISFIITSNSTVTNLPGSMIGRTLDVTLPSEVGKISDPVDRVKAHLVQNYNMTLEQVSDINIAIKSVDVGVGTMIDDHAISLSKVQPQARFS